MLLSYLQESLLRFTGLFMGLFGWPFLLAFIMWHVSQRIRGMGVGLLGMWGYCYFVSPGVVCHETGHALGCILTGEKLIKYVPFKIEEDRLGYITHSVHPGFRGHISQFVIATGPVWFGCSLIVLLSWLFAGSAALPTLGGRYGESGTLVYIVDVALGAWSMLVGLVTGGAWESIAFLFFFYFLFCTQCCNYYTRSSRQNQDIGIGYRADVHTLFTPIQKAKALHPAEKMDENCAAL